MVSSMKNISKIALSATLIFGSIFNSAITYASDTAAGFVAPANLFDSQKKLTLSNVFDNSFSIMSSSGDTHDVTVAEKNGRFFLYDNYQLVGKDSGYTAESVIAAYNAQPIKRRTLVDHLKMGALVGGGSALFVAVAGMLFSPVVEVINAVSYSNGPAVSGVIDMTLGLGAMMGIGAVGTSAVYEKFGGQNRVFKTMTTFLSQLQKGELEKSHVEVWRLESENYASMLQKVVTQLDSANQNSVCVAQLK